MSERGIRRAARRRSEREAGRRHRRGARLAAGAGAALGATVVFAPAAQADTFTVTNLDNDGNGSLREAVEDANQQDGDDVIAFQAGLTGTIALSGADSDIEIYYDGLDIQGPGAGQITVDGGGHDRIFFLYKFQDPDEQVRVAGLTLTDGYAPELGARCTAITAAARRPR
jgi:hypothetical protein